MMAVPVERNYIGIRKANPGKYVVRDVISILLRYYRIYNATVIPWSDSVIC
jgi:hypothetical protein